MSIHPVELFCSYANADEPLYLELEKHLSLLHREGVISCWHKRQIIAGTDWTKALGEHLNTASVILLLVSGDFVASDYCYGTEMQRAMERYEAGDAHVIPILLRPVDWQNAPFGKLHTLPSSGKPITQWRNRDAAFADVAQGIRMALEDIPPCPTLPGKQKKFNSIYLMKIIEEQGVTTPDTNLRSPMEFSRNLLRSLIPSLVHLKIAPRQASWHEEEEISAKWLTCDGTRKMAVWLAAEGDVTYVIDSITIGHCNRRGPIGLSARSGAVLPDAQYRFPIRADSTKTYALNPALVLSHEDRREVSFSLKLIPPKKKKPLSLIREAL